MSDKTVKEIYDLDYDKNETKSGLINWYNNLLNKIPAEINATDVSKMIRQNILRDFALEGLVHLLVENPFDGEMYDGDLLNLLNSFDKQEIKRTKEYSSLISRFERMEEEINTFDWITEKDRELFESNLNKFWNVFE